MTAGPNPQPGWYPDPTNPARQLFWDGATWNNQPAAFPSQQAGLPSSPNKGRKTAVGLGALVLGVVGLMMSMQSVSLLTGSGPVWTGVAVVAGGLAAALFLSAANWARAVVAVMLVVSLGSAIYIEKQMSDRRDELTHLFDS